MKNKTNKQFFMKEKGMFREIEFINNIISYEAEEDVIKNSAKIKITRYRFNRIYSYDFRLDLDKILFYGIREKGEKLK